MDAASRAKEALRRAKLSALGERVPDLPRAEIVPEAAPDQIETVEVVRQSKPGEIPFDADGQQEVRGRFKLPKGWGGGRDDNAMVSVSEDTRGGDADVLRVVKLPPGFNPWKGSPVARAELEKSDTISYPGMATAANEARRALGGSKRDVARAAGVHEAVITALERGTLPPDSDRAAIAKALDLAPADLYPDEHRELLPLKRDPVKPPPGSPAAANQ